MKPGILGQTGGPAVALLLASCAAAGPPAVEGIPPMHTPVAQYVEGEFSSEHGERRYRLYVPAPGEGDPAAPSLIVMLHGCTQDAADFARGTGANAAADRTGSVVLYPEQPPSANPQKCWSWFDPAHQTRDRGEPAILAAMTRDVARRVGADPERIYVAGISAGGSMAQILAATYPDLYRALAVHSSPAYRSARDVPTALTILQEGVTEPARLADAVLEAMGDRARPMPTLVIHGDQDAIVTPINGEQVLRQWGEVAARLGGVTPAEGGPDLRDPAHPGCPSVGGFAPVRHALPMGGTRCEYPNAPVPLEYWVLTDLGHAWSGGSAEGTYTDPRGPDATAAIFEFFARPMVVRRPPRH